MSSIKYEKVSMFCPNCGHKIVGTKGDDGSLKIECDRCKVVIFSKPRGAREINIKLITKRAG